MSWNNYIIDLTKTNWVDDAVIVEYAAGQESVLASVDGGWLGQVSSAEVQAIVAKDRNDLFVNGLTLAGRKCTVLRDCLDVDGLNVMDIKMPEPSSFTIGKSHKALIIAKGSQDVHRSTINPLVSDLIRRLRAMDD